MAFGDDKPPSVTQRVRRALDRLFVDRELLLRSQDQVRYIKFSRRTQVLLAGVAGLALLWGAYVNLSYLGHHQSQATQTELLAERQAANLALRDEIARLQDRVQEGRIAALTEALASAERDRDGLMAEREVLNRQLAASKSDLGRAESELAASQAARETGVADLRALHRSHDALATRHAALARETEELRASLESAADRQVDLDRVLASRDASAGAARQSAVSLEGRLAFAEAAKRDLEIALSRKAEALQEQQALVAAAKEGSTRLAGRQTALESELASLSERLSASEASRAALRQALAERDTRLAALDRSLDSLQGSQEQLLDEQAALGDALARSEAERDRLAGEVAFRSGALAEAAERRAALRAMELRLEQRLDATEREVASARDAVQVLEARREALESYLSQAQSDAEALEAERDSGLATIAGLEGALRAAKSESGLDQQQIVGLRRDLAVARQEQARLERRETEIVDERRGLQAQVTGLKELQESLHRQRRQVAASLVAERQRSETQLRLNEELQAEAQSLKAQLALTTGSNRQLSVLLASTRSDLAATDRRLRDLAVERDRLALAMDKTSNALGAVEYDRQELADERDQLRAVLMERDASLEAENPEKERLATRVGELEDLIVDMRDRQRDIVDRLDLRTLDTIASLEGLIDTAGLDVEALLAQVAGSGTSQGGPFIPADELLASDVAYELQVSVALLDLRLDRWDALQRLVAALPLQPPLKSYKITSEFGYRRDPVNGRRSFHNGIDLATKYKAPLVAAAPGQVIFSGWRGGYGRVVEIDHGFGLKSRFAHMSKISVKKGDQVVSGDLIGLVGSSGRATGPHVHYEILFDGVHQDPKNFFRAGRHVQ
ncbi:MAG: hypothetical protein Kilf2KO_38090 [Rhodospirillales bacterium]